MRTAETTTLLTYCRRKAAHRLTRFHAALEQALTAAAPGNQAVAVAFFGKEKSAWPESRAIIEALITNVDTKRLASTPVEMKPESVEL